MQISDAKLTVNYAGFLHTWAFFAFYFGKYVFRESSASRSLYS